MKAICQTGYLTLRSDLNKTSTVALGIPNGELYKALNKLLATKFLKVISMFQMQMVRIS